jgi:hypothetical protein
MPGKKAHKPRNLEMGARRVNARVGGARKSAGQTAGQYERDPKRRMGQYGGAGNPPLIKK